MIVQEFQQEDPRRYNTLKFLIDLSRHVVKFSKLNMMVAYNVAISFGPVIFRSRHLYREDIMAVKIHYDVMIKMIQDNEEIFVDSSSVQLGNYQVSSLASYDNTLGSVLGLRTTQEMPGLGKSQTATNKSEVMVEGSSKKLADLEEDTEMLAQMQRCD